jgi:hypothetical protein
MSSTIPPKFKAAVRDGDGEFSSTNSSDSSDSFSQVYENTPPFPVDAMPVKTRAFIRDASRAIDCPTELVALPVLATLSAALGRARVVEVKRGHIQTASIYSIAIAESGAGKSPAAKMAWNPLKKIQVDNGKRHKAAVEGYEDEMRAHALKVKLARKNDEVEPKPPAKPKFERTWVDNTTIEALAGLLEGNPNGLAIFQDELSGWLGSFDQYKSGGKGDTRQQFIRIWSGDTVAIDRKNEPEPVIIHDPFITVSGSIQPRLIEKMDAEREDGFINRFLMVYPEPHFSQENDHEISLESEQSYEDLVENLYDLRPEVESEDPPTRVTFNLDARELYKKYSNELASRAGNPGNPQTLRETYPKLRAYLARLCLLVETCRELEAGGDMVVTADDVEAAYKLVSYFERVAKKVFHELASSDTFTKNAFELSSLLRRKGGSITATADDLRRALPSAPDTPEATSKLIRKIARSTPQITVEDGWKGKDRVMKISLLLEKTVGTVGTVGDDS